MIRSPRRLTGQPTGVGRVVAGLEEGLAEFERRLAENPEGSVVIQADQDAYTETVVLVADAARQAKINRVSISGKTED